SSCDPVMSVIAAMWSQSIPWRKPKRNAEIRTPMPNASPVAASTDPLPAALRSVGRHASTNVHGTATATVCRITLEARGLPPGTEDRLQRDGDLSLGAARPRAADQRLHQVRVGIVGG